MSRDDWARDVRGRLSSLRLSPARELEIVEELSQHLDDRWFVAIARLRDGVADTPYNRGAARSTH